MVLQKLRERQEVGKFAGPPSQRLHSREGVLGLGETLSMWREKLLITNTEGKNW